MKVQIASDLHLEYLQTTFPGECGIPLAHGTDLLEHYPNSIKATGPVRQAIHQEVGEEMPCRTL